MQGVQNEAERSIVKKVVIEASDIYVFEAFDNLCGYKLEYFTYSSFGSIFMKVIVGYCGLLWVIVDIVAGCVE